MGFVLVFWVFVHCPLFPAGSECLLLSLVLNHLKDVWWSCTQHCLFIFKNWALGRGKDPTLCEGSCHAHYQLCCELIPGWLLSRTSKNVNIWKPTFWLCLWKHLPTSSSPGVTGSLEVVGTHVIVLETGRKGSAFCFTQTFSCVFWINFCRNKLLLLWGRDKAVDPTVLLRHGPPCHLPVHHIHHTMSSSGHPTLCMHGPNRSHATGVLWICSESLTSFDVFFNFPNVERSCLFSSLSLSARIFLQFFCILARVWVVANTRA